MMIEYAVLKAEHDIINELSALVRRPEYKNGGLARLRNCIMSEFISLGCDLEERPEDSTEIFRLTEIVNDGAMEDLLDKMPKYYEVSPLAVYYILLRNLIGANRVPTPSASSWCELAKKLNRIHER